MIEKKSGWARVKSATVYIFGHNDPEICSLTCYPQQRWRFEEGKDYVRLVNDKKHITLTIPKVNFVNNWEVTENRKEENVK